MKNTKYIAVMMLSCTSMPVFAMANGFYMGLMFGPATNNAPSLQAQVPNPPLLPNGKINTTIANPRHNQFASSFYLGNQFNTYAGIEGGFTFFSSINYDTRDVQTYGGTTQRVRDIYLVGKGIFPFSDTGFSIYGKAGVAASYLTMGGALNPTYKPNAQPPKLSGSTTYKHKFSPTFAIGASYDINQSWQTELSYNSVQVGDNIGSVSFFALGLSYHFTDKYCGQFLCDD